jgi:hypothetical protein
MTRLPGLELINIDMPFEENLEGPWVGELKKCLDTMRTWDSPYGQRICSPINTSIKSSRVPKHVMGPFENEAALHEYLLKPASSHSFASREKYEETLALARRIQERPHQVVFTHGDFKEHNVLVDDDSNLTGWLDWESAGWYPEYWEFTTARRMGRDTWWGQAVSGLRIETGQKVDPGGCSPTDKTFGAGIPAALAICMAMASSILVRLCHFRMSPKGSCMSCPSNDI